ncbi:hypothetical protein DesLBE_2745 [Desulfitobacterium sp. LBE]|nr:hypothetical protein [Desulfitobacterium sp. LBE]TWH58421.1 hypothetical protein DesLBE_2745 [Desulfitobacterium sp. LBE]
MEREAFKLVNYKREHGELSKIRGIFLCVIGETSKNMRTISGTNLSRII